MPSYGSLGIYGVGGVGVMPQYPGPQQPSVLPTTSLNAARNQAQNQAQSTQSAQNQAQSNSFIPDFSQTPILEEIAKYAESMAPQVYDWGMQQFNRNQGNIDSLMRAGQEWASPAHIATQMGQAEAGVQQAGEQARESALRDLQSYGIDPSAGRYASLDNASRVQTAASAAGAGNQQRNADIAQGLTMQNQAMSAGLQNTQTGYGAANAMNSLLGTGMSLKYSPLGTTSSSTGVSSGESTSSGTSSGGTMGFSGTAPDPRVAGGGVGGMGSRLALGGMASTGFQEGGYIKRGSAERPGYGRGRKPKRGGQGRSKGPPKRPQDDQAQEDPQTMQQPSQPTDLRGPTPALSSAPPPGPPSSPLPGSPPATSPMEYGGGYGEEPPALPQDEGFARGGAVKDPIARDIQRQAGVPETDDDSQYGSGGSGNGSDNNGDDDSGYAGGGVVGTTTSGFVPTNPVAAPAGYTTAAPVRGFARGGTVGYGETTGGFVSHALSPSNGKQVDDVPARLNEGEYVIPRDVVHWRGKEFFHKLIAQSRTARAKHGAPSDDRGYNLGGEIQSDDSGFNLGGAI